MEFNYKKIDSKKFFRSFSLFWQKNHAAVFFVFLMIMLLSGGYIWRKSVYQSDWSSEQKIQYINQQNSGVVLQEGKFQRVMDDIKARKNFDINSYQQEKDVFTPYK